VQPWASCLYTCASVTKQYNLVPANGRWCLAAWKVTVGLASHWPHITDISGSPPMGLRPGRGRWAPPYALLWSTVDFTFTYDCNFRSADVFCWTICCSVVSVYCRSSTVLVQTGIPATGK